jgi:hypothetical protein
MARKSVIVRADEAHEHVRELIAKGANYATIGKAAGLSESVVQGVGSGRRETLTRASARKILAVRDAPLAFYRSATRARNELRALAVMGWDMDTLTERLGFRHSSYLSEVRKGESVNIEEPFDVAIHAFYEANKDIPGPSRLCAARAAGQGWPHPSQWEGVDMSDPAARARGAAPD